MSFLVQPEYGDTEKGTAEGMLDTERKAEIAEEYGRHESDTGSPEVQIAVMTERIKDITEHLKDHQGDKATQRGLRDLVGKRRRLLDYLRREDEQRYKNIVESLGLRG